MHEFITYPVPDGHYVRRVDCTDPHLQGIGDVTVLDVEDGNVRITFKRDGDIARTTSYGIDEFRDRFEQVMQ